MRYRTSILLSSLALAALMAGGCASRGDVETLQTDVDALTRVTETQRRDAAEALEIARRNDAELDEVRALAERAARDAAVSRRLLEALDGRMAEDLGTGTFK